MRFTETGVARALRVYAAIAQSIGCDGPKHDKPIEEDRVFRLFASLRARSLECDDGQCHNRSKRLRDLAKSESEQREALLAIGNICLDAGFGDGHIVDAVRRMAEAAKR